MSVFSTNQNRQFYVATKAATAVTEASDAGEILLKSINNGVGKDLYFLVKGAENVLKSDFIPVKNLSYVKAIAAAKMRTPLKSVLISLDSDVNGGVPVVGQDYILRINFRQFYGMSDQDQYFKDVAVHATKALTPDAKSFYTELVKALNLAFSREVGATVSSNPYLEFTAKDTGVEIVEKEQPWTLGTQAQEPVLFEIVPTTIYVDGEDVDWATKTDTTKTTGGYVKNGKKIADLEYFCMGERGDQYRQIGWPNNIDTKYLVDPTAEYNVLELHYAFTDEGISSYRSEKDITIVSTDASVINALVKAINTETGLSIVGTDDAVPTSEEAEDKAVAD